VNVNKECIFDHPIHICNYTGILFVFVRSWHWSNCNIMAIHTYRSTLFQYSDIVSVYWCHAVQHALPFSVYTLVEIQLKPFDFFFIVEFHDMNQKYSGKCPRCYWCKTRDHISKTIQNTRRNALGVLVPYCNVLTYLWYDVSCWITMSNKITIFRNS